MPKIVACFSGGNADPRIAHGEVQIPRPFGGVGRDEEGTIACGLTGSIVEARHRPLRLCSASALAGHFQHDLAALRELDGIVDEIDHDLPQSMVVAHDPSGHVVMDMAGQLQPLLVGADGERFHRVAQAFAEVELLAFQHELLGLDLGEVEDVVDHAEQGLARIADGRQELALLGRELALEDQFGHADHGVQGRANFMAHVGQEGALGPAGRFGRLFRRPQGFRHPLLRGDVLGNAEGADDLPRVVIQRQFRAGSPGGMSVRPGFLLFLVDDPLPGADDFLLVGQGLQGMFVGEEVDVGLADRFAGVLQAEHSAPSPC